MSQLELLDLDNLHLGLFHHSRILPRFMPHLPAFLGHYRLVGGLSDVSPDGKVKDDERCERLRCDESFQCRQLLMRL
jgi:hypothetical protein